jgi:hypothetical protein
MGRTAIISARCDHHPYYTDMSAHLPSGPARQCPRYSILGDDCMHIEFDRCLDNLRLCLLFLLLDLEVSSGTPHP